jgi:hypothetical protein
VVVDLRLDARVALPGVAHDERAGLDVPPDEVVEGLAAVIADDLQPQPPERVLAPLDRDDDLDGLAALSLPPALQPCLLAANPGLVHLDRAGQPAPVGVDHRPAQLVEQEPRRLKPGEAELPLELER